nr:helix-turn-helix domain-containing protein [uncultured Draconibacterium sp.]
MKQTRTEAFKQSWIDGQDVMLALKVSKRTLQTMRDTGILPYSRINGKFYYKVEDLEKLLESNYSRNFKSGSHD